MTVKTGKQPRWYQGPAIEDASSPTGYSAEQYDLNDPAEYKAWEAAWSASLKVVAAAEPVPARSAREATTAAPFEGDPIKKARESEAIAYIGQYTGKFGLILDLRVDRRFGSKWFHLSERQVEVVLNSKAREAAWAAERIEADKRKAEPLVDAPTVPKLPVGRRYYAVTNDAGATTFLRISRTERDFTYVDQMVGGGYEEQGNGRSEPRGRVLPSGQYVGTFESLYRKVIADPAAAMARYGLEMGRCGYCGRDLTDEESRTRGIGPVCYAKAFGG